MRLFISFATLLIALSACHIPVDNSIIYFNTEKEYPELDLDLSDIAEIRYVKLSGEEQGLIINEISSDIYFDETRDQIILCKRTHSPSFIAVFDINGHFLRQISHEGFGPGEYYDCPKIAYQEREDILTIFSPYNGKIIQYHSSGEFIREREFNFISPFNNVFVLDDKILLLNVFSQYATNITSDLANHTPFNDHGRSLRAIDLHTLEDIPVKNHHFGEVMDNNIETVTQPKEGYCLTDEGILFACARTDTTYLLDHNLEVLPFLIDISHNREKGFLLAPTFETKEYLFLHLIPPYDANLKNKHRYFAIRRSDKAIFSCGSDSFFSLFSSESLSIGRDIQSITPGYGRYVLFKDYIPDPPNPSFPVPHEVEVLAKSMNSESNPILMIIKFK